MNFWKYSTKFTLSLFINAVVLFVKPGKLDKISQALVCTKRDKNYKFFYRHCVKIHDLYGHLGHFRPSKP